MTATTRVALVTASSRSIGRGIAEALLRAGMCVVISGRSQEKGRTAEAELSALGAVSFIAADALSQHDIESLVDRTLAQYGRLDVLVNNAGGSSGFAPVHELSDTAWNEAFHWNVSSAFYATRRALPAMLQQQFGRIINIGSVQGKQANRPNASHYVMAKHALNGFTKAVALEYGRAGITCNTICVGAVETDLMRDAGATAAAASGISYEEHVRHYAERAMTGRLNTTAEVGAMAALLASDAGAGITGAILNVDGGICPY
jgi:3-hydroxybutyrate dehydrogenase